MTARATLTPLRSLAMVRLADDLVVRRKASAGPENDTTGSKQPVMGLLPKGAMQVENSSIRLQGDQLLTKSGESGTEAAWRDLAHVLLCTNEFIYVD